MFRQQGKLVFIFSLVIGFTMKMFQSHIVKSPFKKPGNFNWTKNLWGLEFEAFTMGR